MGSTPRDQLPSSTVCGSEVHPLKAEGVRGERLSTPGRPSWAFSSCAPRRLL